MFFGGYFDVRSDYIKTKGLSAKLLANCNNQTLISTNSWTSEVIEAKLRDYPYGCISE